ncbi:anti-sigma factor domain-containing protein [Paraliobacillus sediminis]|uniref:anti-sigma-I factor RsgI family protein n=1 Tax=Paraliobacillus sediminis TaxID=1885916 RepID=UPI000E3D0552|nr:hypothetical protein [Paraliobacillus sediminis]
MRSRRFEGVVIKVTENYITILCKDGSFKNTPRSESEFPQIGDAYTVSEKQYLKGAFKKKYLSLAAILFLTVMGYYISTFMTEDESYLFAIDINPSIEIYTDAAFNVTKVNALNYDGQVVMDSIADQNKQIDIMLEEIITAAVEGEYLTRENAQIDVTVVSLTDKNEVDTNKVKETINQSLESNAVTAAVRVESGSQELVEDAREENLSINKLQLYKHLEEKEIELELEPDELRDNSISKINGNVKNEQTDSEKTKSDGQAKAKEDSLKKVEKPTNATAEKKNKSEKNQVNKPAKAETNQKDKPSEIKKEEQKPVEVNKPKPVEENNGTINKEETKESMEKEDDRKEMQDVKKKKSKVESKKDTSNVEVEANNIENRPEKKGKPTK